MHIKRTNSTSVLLVIVIKRQHIYANITHLIRWCGYNNLDTRTRTISTLKDHPFSSDWLICTYNEDVGYVCMAPLNFMLFVRCKIFCQWKFTHTSFLFDLSAIFIFNITANNFSFSHFIVTSLANYLLSLVTAVGNS
jgi:hypothetical protein